MRTELEEVSTTVELINTQVYQIRNLFFWRATSSASNVIEFKRQYKANVFVYLIQRSSKRSAECRHRISSKKAQHWNSINLHFYNHYVKTRLKQIIPHLSGLLYWCYKKKQQTHLIFRHSLPNLLWMCCLLCLGLYSSLLLFCVPGNSCVVSFCSPCLKQGEFVYLVTV